jgi:hypothetical protein
MIYRTIVEAFDFPSGSILGLFTLIFIGMCVHAYSVHGDIPASVVDGYKFVVGAFAGSKTLATMWGKFAPKSEPPKE